MKKLIVLAVIATGLVITASSYACVDQICQLVHCAPPNNQYQGWQLVEGAGWEDTISAHGGARCALACYPQQCWGGEISAATVPEVTCNNPDSVGAIAFVNPTDEGILLIKDIKLSKFSSYTESLEQLAVTDGVPFEQLAHAIQVSNLPFAHKDIVVYATYEAYVADLHKQLQQIYAKALWDGTHKQKNGN